jgi:hypothetical protein
MYSKERHFHLFILANGGDKIFYDKNKETEK